jgi:hypothetical protein
MKSPFKWASIAIALLLVACGAKYLPALWSTQFDVEEGTSLLSSTVTRELANGSIRIAYRRDVSTLVVDTYDSAGNRLTQDEFNFPGSSLTEYYAKPLFASDDELYWFGRDAQHSVKIDLATNTMQPLSDLLGLDLGGAEAFEFNGAILLENGQLVLAGSDRFASSHPPVARVVVMDADGSVQTVALESHQPFTNLVARSGTDQYLVQSFVGNLGFPILLPTTYLGDSNILVEQPQISQGRILQADQNGAWVTQIGGAGLFRYNAALELAHQDDSLLAMKIQPTSDQNYLMAQMAGNTGLRYVKTDSTGNLLWEIPASANATLDSGLTEQNGRILLSETTRTRAKSVLAQGSDPVMILPISNVTAKVRHRLLDADGKELARFSEPDYKATLQRDPVHGNDSTALEFSAGSCEHTQALLLSSGDFAALSRWCTDNNPNNDQQALHYFKQP